MTLERSLALGVVLALQIVRHVLENLDIRLDALGLNRSARRRVIARRRQAQGAVLAKRNDRLHRALAERAGADQRGALVILQRARDDFRGRGRAAVDEDDHRLAVRQIAAGPRIVALRLVGIAPARRDDLAALEEGVDDFDRLIEQAAGIVAQIENVALQLVAAERPSGTCPSRSSDRRRSVR